MKIGDECCSLELSKKLKELGVSQESLFYWIKFFNWDIFLGGKHTQDYHSECLSAFTAAELMEMLPAYIDNKINEPFNFFGLSLNKRSSKNIQYIINYHCDSFILDAGRMFNPFSDKLIPHNICDENLANCLAKTLIYLTENKLIEKNEEKK